MKKLSLIVLVLAATSLTACGSQGGSGDSRDAIHAVGSSTVYPFARTVSETFSREYPEFPAANIESIGTGGGIATFCSGIGFNTPDFANASRRMKLGEFETCAENGVTEIVEIQVGMDGIAFASAQGGIDMALTPELVYRALAANPYGEEQTATNWNDVDPSLPDLPILVYGPPSTSGTRDALTELIMEVGCKTDPATKALKDSNKAEFEAICHEIRADGAYIDAGENDNLIVQKLKANPNSVGIFGYSFLEENLDSVRGIPVSGVEPTYEAIASGKYPGARPLYIYVKKQHIGVIPGLKDYVLKFLAAGASDGYLVKAGLIASPEDVRANMLEMVQNMTPLAISDLK